MGNGPEVVAAAPLGAVDAPIAEAGWGFADDGTAEGVQPAPETIAANASAMDRDGFVIGL